MESREYYINLLTQKQLDISALKDVKFHLLNMIDSMEDNYKDDINRTKESYPDITEEEIGVYIREHWKYRDITQLIAELRRQSSIFNDWRMLIG